ncbi:MAG: hypothetical protein MHM6MM_002742 [Cercozoa sp. M6MM]
MPAPGVIPVSEVNNFEMDALDARLRSDEMALTFDDGPDTLTNETLNLLNAYGVRATFFVLGQKTVYESGALQRAALSGHEIGVHTYTHPAMTTLPAWDQEIELNSTIAAIQNVLPGYTPRYFRPPYGDTNEQLMQLALQKCNLSQALWSIDTLDWDTTRSSDDIAADLLRAKGHVVLMHDGLFNTPETVKALQKALPKLIASGIRFRTLSELDMRENSYDVDALYPPPKLVSRQTCAPLSNNTSNSNESLAVLQARIASLQAQLATRDELIQRFRDALAYVGDFATNASSLTFHAANNTSTTLPP